MCQKNKCKRLRIDNVNFVSGVSDLEQYNEMPNCNRTLIWANLSWWEKKERDFVYLSCPIDPRCVFDGQQRANPTPTHRRPPRQARRHHSIKWSPPSLSLSLHWAWAGWGKGAGVSRGRRRREMDRRGPVAAPSLFRCAGLGPTGARIRVLGGAEGDGEELEQGASGSSKKASPNKPTPFPLFPFFFIFFYLLQSITIFKNRSQIRSQFLTEYVSVTIFHHKKLEICEKKIWSQFLKFGHKFWPIYNRSKFSVTKNNLFCSVYYI